MFGFAWSALILAAILLTDPAWAQGLPWPDPDSLRGQSGQPLDLASQSPFTLRDIGGPDASPTTVRASLFMPADASPTRQIPAVVLLHGSAGISEMRETTYARQFAAQGIAGLVVETFGSRRERGTGFLDRVLNITETMMVADAYAALQALAARPDIDAKRVAVMGFSYGGMAALFAAYAQLADALAPAGVRFAAHVGFYGPCIARFENPRTTGAPILMLSGSGDAIVDPVRCAEIATDLRSGGSSVESVVYEGAYHGWDGSFGGPRKIGRNLAPCRLWVSTGGWVLDSNLGLPMVDSFSRKLILGLCSDPEGYLIGRDDQVRARSNAEVRRFLGSAFARASERR